MVSSRRDFSLPGKRTLDEPGDDRASYGKLRFIKRGFGQPSLEAPRRACPRRRRQQAITRPAAICCADMSPRLHTASAYSLATNSERTKPRALERRVSSIPRFDARACPRNGTNQVMLLHAERFRPEGRAPRQQRTQLLDFSHSRTCSGSPRHRSRSANIRPRERQDRSRAGSCHLHTPVPRASAELALDT